MEEKDVRCERIGPIARLRVRYGRCPECGGRLVDEVDGGLISSWTWTPDKYTARTVGLSALRGLPSVHNVDTPPCKRCDACERWYLGKWAYRRKAE